MLTTRVGIAHLRLSQTYRCLGHYPCLKHNNTLHVSTHNNKRATKVEGYKKNNGQGRRDLEEKK